VNLIHIDITVTPEKVWRLLNGTIAGDVEARGS
jgi:hypothetical protein